MHTSKTETQFEDEPPQTLLANFNQSQKNPVGVSALPTGKFLRVWKVFARIYKIGLKSTQNIA